MPVILLTPSGNTNYNFSFGITVQDYSQAYDFKNALSGYTLGAIIEEPFNIKTAVGVSPVLKHSDITIYYIANDINLPFDFNIKDKQNYNFKFSFNVKSLEINKFRQTLRTVSGVDNLPSITNKFTTDNRVFTSYKYDVSVNNYKRTYFTFNIKTGQYNVYNLLFPFKIKNHSLFHKKDILTTGVSGNKLNFKYAVKVPYDSWEFKFKWNLTALAFNYTTEIIVEESDAS